MKSDALRDLIEAVEAGQLDYMVGQALKVDDLTRRQCHLVSDSYRGSLDAAKALHEALLAGWAREIWSAQDEDADAKVYPPLATGQEFTGRTEGIDVFSAEVDGDNPARAWLISILKAHEAQQ